MKVTVAPGGHAYEGRPDRTLLQSAADAGFLLPCNCRNGSCGRCKGRLLSGCVDHGDPMESALSLDERASGMLLLCCARPLSDVTVECQDIDVPGEIKVRRIATRLGRVQWLDDLAVVDLEIPSNRRLQFLPGQSIAVLGLDGVRRSFYLANAPADDRPLRILVPRDGIRFLSGHTSGDLKSGQVVRIEGPYGDPTNECGNGPRREQQGTIPGPRALLAEGPGLAAISSVVEQQRERGISAPLRLYVDADAAEASYLLDAALRWSAAPVCPEYLSVSRASPSGNNGRGGSVVEAALADAAALSDHEIHAFGPRQFVREVHRAFQRAGFRLERITADDHFVGTDG